MPLRVHVHVVHSSDDTVYCWSFIECIPVGFTHVCIPHYVHGVWMYTLLDVCTCIPQYVHGVWMYTLLDVCTCIPHYVHGVWMYTLLDVCTCIPQYVHGVWMYTLLDVCTCLPHMCTYILYLDVYMYTHV